MTFNSGNFMLHYLFLYTLKQKYVIIKLNLKNVLTVLDKYINFSTNIIIILKADLCAINYD